MSSCEAMWTFSSEALAMPSSIAKDAKVEIVQFSATAACPCRIRGRVGSAGGERQGERRDVAGLAAHAELALGSVDRVHHRHHVAEGEGVVGVQDAAIELAIAG